MSDDKKKVKDLAADLGMAPKDVIAAAKELGITAAKVAASSLTEAEAAKVREKLQPSEKPGVEVIVRRRRAPKAADGDETATDANISAAPPEPEPAPAQAPADAAAEEVPPAEPKKNARRVTSPARVVQLPGEPAVETTGMERDDKGQEESAARAAPAAVESATVPPAVEPSAEVAQPEEGEREESAPKKARIVRPAEFSAEPDRGADGQAVSSAPAMPARSEQGAEQGALAEDGTTRTVSQVRVISRPDPAQTQRQYAQTDASRARPGAGRPRPGTAAGGDARPPRPGGRPAPSSPSARPSGGGSKPGGVPGAFAPAPESDQNRKKRQKGRRTVDFTDTRAKSLDQDQGWSHSPSRRGGKRKQRDAAPMGGTQPLKAVKRKIKVDEFIRVSDLAHQMGLKSGEIIKVLFSLGVMATINQSLDIETATLVAVEFGYEIEKTGFSEKDIIDAQQDHFEENAEDLAARPPVVTIMGHVDHGKTSLLDAIRKSSVVTGEAGGITQHIGAYHVTTQKGEIVFLDTPGHEAFTAMRARGAEITDIVVLVVAADDGVMEQTREAINHAKAAGVPIMVAVNKMDKESANPDRVKRELAEQGLVPEEWGGDTTFSYVSAKTREGLDDLLDLLALQAEILELKANPKRPAAGHIIEAKLDKGRGALGTVLIQQGTLRVGESFVCGVHSGRVRAMFNDQGKKVKEAGPSIPVEVQGFEGVPEAGEEFLVIADEKQARRIAEARALKQRERELAKESKITLETFLARKADSVDAEVLNLVVKADVQGSLEAISDALRKLSTDKVRINVIHGGTGAVSESDVLLCTASSAIIIGFNVRPTAKAKELAEQEKVDIRFYDIIYKLVDEIKSAMEGMLAPLEREVFLGTAEVRETFSVPKVGVIAGCHVSDGKIVRNAQARLLRDGVVVHSGKIGSLRRFKDDVREVAKGYECGIGLENYNDIKVGDVVEAFEIVEEAATL